MIVCLFIVIYLQVDVKFLRSIPLSTQKEYVKYIEREATIHVKQRYLESTASNNDKSNFSLKHASGSDDHGSISSKGKSAASSLFYLTSTTAWRRYLHLSLVQLCSQGSLNGMGCSNLSFSKKRLDIQYNKCLIRVKPNS